MLRVVKGMLTCIPGIKKITKKKCSGETSSAKYCYGVWLKHLVLLYDNGMNRFPETILELGPGASVGVGIAAVISGVGKYYAIDIAKYSEYESNIQIFEQLVAMFKGREAYPDVEGFPDIKPFLNEKGFPEEILSSEHLDACLDEKRLGVIRSVLEGRKPENDLDIDIKYVAQWGDSDIIGEASVDLIFSHAVLEHMDNITEVFPQMCRWLRRGGYMSHQIDFSCHGTADSWNGHWAYSDIVWNLIKGRRTYSINRLSYSFFENLLTENGFEITCIEKEIDKKGIERSKIAKKFRMISEDDLVCKGAFIQAKKL